MGRCTDLKNQILKPIMDSMRMTKMQCQKICQLDPSGSYCVGCNRTVDEIFQAGIDKPSDQDYRGKDDG